MTEQRATKILAYSFYPLALGIFVSVSLIPLYQILIFIAFLLFLKQKELSFKNLPNSTKALLGFIIIQLLSALVNISDLQETSRSLGTLKYPLLAVIGLMLFRNEKIQNNNFLLIHAKRSLNLFLFTIALAFSYSVIKVYSGLDYFKEFYYAVAADKESTRFSGFTETMRYGYGTGLTVLILLACFIHRKKLEISNNWLLLALLTGFAGMYLSYTRGSLLAVLICLPVIVYFYNRKVAIWATVTSLLIVGFMVTISLMGGSDSSRLLQKSDSKSNQVRIAQYWAAIYEVKEKPLLGYGPNQFKYHSKEMKIKYNLGFEYFDSHTHNIFLQVAADSGLLGLSAFLAWMFFWFRETYKNGNN